MLNHRKRVNSKLKSINQLKSFIGILEKEIKTGSNESIDSFFQKYKQKLLSQTDRRGAITAIKMLNTVSKNDLNKVKEIILKDHFKERPLSFYYYKLNTNLYNFKINIYQYSGIIISRGQLYQNSTYTFEKLVNLGAAALIASQALNGSIACGASFALMGLSLGTNLLINFVIESYHSASKTSQEHVQLFGVLISNIVTHLLKIKLFNLVNLELAGITQGLIEDYATSALLAYVGAAILTTQLSRLQQGAEILFSGGEQINENLKRQINSNLYDLARNNTHSILNFCIKLIISVESLSDTVSNSSELIRPLIVLGLVVNSRIRDTIANRFKSDDNEFKAFEKDNKLAQNLLRFTLYYIKSYLKPLNLEQICTPIAITQDLQNIAFKTILVVVPSKIIDEIAIKLNLNTNSLKTTETIKALVIG